MPSRSHASTEPTTGDGAFSGRGGSSASSSIESAGGRLGRRLAFTGESGLRYGDRDSWTVDVGGGGLRRLTRTGDALWPVWAPDGRSIVYARLEGRSQDADGSLDYSSSLWGIDPYGGTPDG
jgi:Tol biopolymer transport system component